MLVTNFKFKYLVYKIVCGIYQALDVGTVHPVRELSLRALTQTADYIEEAMPDALGFFTQREVTEFTLQEINLEGHYLEFGVFRGGTIRFMAKRVGKNIIHGFDSFEGLPENWTGFYLGKGAFDTKGRLPKVPKNVHLYQGWFDETLPRWLEKYPGPMAFIHIDCDLYSSTKTIFELLGERICPGTVILFDEYFNFHNWQKHEYKAFQEFVKEHNVTYEYLGYARQQVSLKILSIGGES